MTQLRTLRDLAKAGAARIQRVALDGQVFWIKRPENLGLRMRLQKGDPVAAFAQEVAAHHRFVELGLPVPEIVADGHSYLITRDAGPTLTHIFGTGLGQEFHKALFAAAQALAGCHAAGISHGRPSLKDICWKDGRITFLDFERAASKRNGDGGQAMDLLILLFSTSVVTAGDHAAMASVRDGYRAAGGDRIWTVAQKRLRRLAILRYLLLPVSWILKGNKEFDAIRPFYAFVAD